MSRAKSGGGINSNKVRQVGVKTGKPAQGHVPCGTIGLARITTTGYREPKVGQPISVELGNQCALNVGKRAGSPTIDPSMRGQTSCVPSDLTPREAGDGPG